MFYSTLVFFTCIGVVASVDCPQGFPPFDTCETADDCMGGAADNICFGLTAPGAGDGGCCPISMTPEATTTAAIATNSTTTARPRVTTTVPTCVDRLHPITGISDCPKRANLCNDAVYYDVMTRQCPKTCNRCSGTTAAPGTTACADRTNTATGINECPALVSYCTNPLYLTLMREECPKTCGFC